MSRCPVCRQRLLRASEALQACEVCGEPVVSDVDLAVGAEGRGRFAVSRRRGLLAAGVVVGLVAATTIYLTSRDNNGNPDAAAYGILKLSSDPGVRWRVQLARIAPDLGCPTKPGGIDEDIAFCSATDAVVTGDMVVVAVQRQQRAELVAVSTDGAVRWHRSAPAGSTYDCLARKRRVWCVTRPLSYTVLTPTTSIDSADPAATRSYTIATKRSELFAGSSLSEIDPRTGTLRHTTPISWSSDDAAIAGVATDGLYVVAGLPENDRATLRVMRYSREGALAWTREVYFTKNGMTMLPGFESPAPVRVFETGGSAYVTAAEVAGRQAIFDAGTGKPSGAESGHVVTVTRDAIVTQRGSGGLTMGGVGVGDSVVAGLAADDRSAGEPVSTGAGGWEPQDLQNPGEGADADGSTSNPKHKPIVLRSMPDLRRSAATIDADDLPLAFCDGVLVSISPAGFGSGQFSGLNPRDGKPRWSGPSPVGFASQTRCAGPTVVLTDGRQVAGVDLKSGRNGWTADLPGDVVMLGGGIGDPGEGVLLGPQDTGHGATATTLTFVR